MTSSPNLDQMTPKQLRALAEQALQLLHQVDSMGQKIHRLETVNEQLAHEIAILKRHKFAKRSEQLSPDQGSLLDDLLDTDIAAIEAELKAVNPPPAPDELRQKPKRAPLPPQFPRTVIRYEPENTQCVCGCQNNPVENLIRPWALGRSNWLFAGSLRSGKRAAATMSLIQSARMNGHDPYAYLKDVLTRLPTQRASEIGQLLPHRWAPA
jgi:hypothetical protein